LRRAYHLQREDHDHEAYLVLLHRGPPKGEGGRSPNIIGLPLLAVFDTRWSAQRFKVRTMMMRRRRRRRSMMNMSMKVQSLALRCRVSRPAFFVGRTKSGRRPVGSCGPRMPTGRHCDRRSGSSRWGRSHDDLMTRRRRMTMLWLLLLLLLLMMTMMMMMMMSVTHHRWRMMARTCPRCGRRSDGSWTAAAATGRGMTTTTRCRWVR
jgi:hypothetical protein